MASIGTCPLEVLELIAGSAALLSPEQKWLPILSLHNILGQKDLNSLSQTCRRLHTFINPLLWLCNRDLKRSSAVVWAVEQGQIASLERANTFGLNIMETVHKSSVTVAIEAGQDSALTWLLDQGASVNQQNNTVWCNISESRLSIPQYALHLAFDARCPSAVLLLLSRGASLEYTMQKKRQDGQLVHAMTEAIEHGMLSVVDHLVTYCGTNVNDQSHTPLPCCCSAAGSR